MDNLTHSLFGALLGQSGLKHKTGLAMPALIIGANIPDIDVTCLAYGAESLAMRRGLTHGPLAWLLLPLALALILWGFDRWQVRRGTRPEARRPVHFGWLWFLAFIATMTHPALDWLNVYGIRLLAPFSETWYYGDTLFIIDVWLWLGLSFALWLSRRREKRYAAQGSVTPPGSKGAARWRRPAIIALTLSIVYIGANGFISQAALMTNAIIMKAQSFPYRGRIEQVIAAPVPFNPLKRQIIAGRHNDWFIGAVPMFGRSTVPHPITRARCAWPDLAAQQRRDPALAAFLFWSRAPFAERAANGTVVLRDARFYQQSARDPFSFALPDIPCRPISG